VHCHDSPSSLSAFPATVIGERAGTFLTGERTTNIGDQSHNGERFGSAHSLIGDIKLGDPESPGAMGGKIVGLGEALSDLMVKTRSSANRPSRAFTSPASMAYLSRASAASICSVIVTIGVGNVEQGRARQSVLHRVPRRRVERQVRLR
jgi:hypothetical protein